MRMVTGAALAAAMLAAPAAHAGMYSDDLGRCVVAKTTEADRSVLIRWIFVMMTRSPVIADLATMSDKQRLDANRGAADLTTRLMASDCRAEAIAALKYEGQSVIESAFGTLGQIAMRGLMSNPAVQGEVAAFSGLLDKEKIIGLYKEAGIATKVDAAATTPAAK